MNFWRNQIILLMFSKCFLIIWKNQIIRIRNYSFNIWHKIFSFCSIFIILYWNHFLEMSQMLLRRQLPGSGTGLLCNICNMFLLALHVSIVAYWSETSIILAWLILGILKKLLCSYYFILVYLCYLFE